MDDELAMEKDLKSEDKNSSPKPGPSSSSPESNANVNGANRSFRMVGQGSRDPDSCDEFESSDEDDEVVFVDPYKKDYVEVPRGKGDPVPETDDLVHISWDKLAPFKALYENQPEKIKEIMRIHFYKGKPVVDPPPLSVFVKKVQTMKMKRKIQKQLEKEEKSPKLKPLPQSLTAKLAKLASKAKEENESKEIKENAKKATVCLAEIKETDNQLIHIDFPGRVVHPDRAIKTMGGFSNIYKVFNNTNKKLPVRFRPEDPHSNASYGEAHPTVGILLKVTRRKPVRRPKVGLSKKGKEETILIDLEEPPKLPAGYVMVNGVPMTKEDILREDKKLLKEVAFENDLSLKQRRNIEDPEEFYLRIPEGHSPKVDPKLKVEAVGLIHRSYRFEGLCDFQYLPMTKTKNGLVSVRDNVLPIFGDPEGQNLFVGEDLVSENTEIERFLLPPMMSRVDRPVDTVIDQLMDSDNVKLIPEMEKARTEDVLSTARNKRNVYTVNYNFLIESAKNPVPTKPLSEAVEDIRKRRMHGSVLTQVAKCFENRPIWTKTALEYETQLPPLTLKYVLPGVSYFANNGPWRSLWIRLGFDPREDPSTFHYQTVDFRVPFCYKQYIEEREITDDSAYIFRPGQLPPKSQMFYQICDLKCDEIEKLIDIATQKMGKYELKYDLKFGWFKEGTFEYIRQVLTQYVELELEEIGKIPKHPVQKVFLEEGELECPERVKPRPRVMRRVRKNPRFKQSDVDNLSTSEQSATVPKRKAKRNPKSKHKVEAWPYQGILQDLSIKDLNDGDAGLGSRDDNTEELEILDDTLPSDESSGESDNEEDNPYDDEDEEEDDEEEAEIEKELAGEGEADDLDLDDIDEDD